MSRRWTDEQIVAALRDWEAIFGSPPIAQDWVTADPEGLYPSSWTVRSHFGSWDAALEATKVPASPKQRRWERYELLAALTKWASEHGGIAPAVGDLGAANDMPSLSTLTAHFGSLNNANRKAGMVPRPAGVNRLAVEKYLPLRREEST